MALHLSVMFRRYLWVFFGGGVLGAGLGIGAWAILWKTHPIYTATIAFEVLPPPTPVGSAPPSVSSGDTAQLTAQLIYRQLFLFEQDAFLQDVMKSDEFQHIPGNPTATQNQWMAEHHNNLTASLRKSLILIPHINEASFEITMQARDPQEARQMVIAASNEFQFHLKQDADKQRNAYLDTLHIAFMNADNELKTARDDLQRFSMARDVDQTHSKLTIQMATLEDLNK
ncbi:MAG TPA: hypothetical protein VGN88_07875, partial [Phycisphaerae bacterium]